MAFPGRMHTHNNNGTVSLTFAIKQHKV